MMFAQFFKCMKPPQKHNKTGNFMVYELYPNKGAVKTGDNVGPWNLLIQYQHSFSRFE